MIDWFINGGLIMWPLVAVALGVIALAFRAAVALRAPATSGDAPRLTPILFWGGVALLLGTLGTVVGLMVAARNIAAAGGASAALIWSGVGVTLTSLVFGILIFLLAGLLWLPLDTWRRRTLAG